MRRDPVATGTDGLDELLSGGFAPGSCNLIEGVPGAGKTTLGIQFIYAGCQVDEPGIIVTFEQFPQHIQNDALALGWDLRELEDEGKLRTICILPEIFLDQLKEVGGLVDTAISEIGAKRLLMDSVSHLEQMGAAPGELRSMAYSMMNGLRRAGLTSVITKELQRADTDDVPFEEYLSDCVVRMRYDAEADGSRRRYIEVLKSRGAPHIPGKHTLELTDHGVDVFARPQASSRDAQTWESGLQRCGCGVLGLDELLGGGLVRGFSCLVAGSAGVGKTTLGLQFVCDGAQADEPAVYVSFEESAPKLVELARAYGLPLGRHREKGTIEIIHRSPLDVRKEKLIHDVMAAVDRLGAKRVVIDSLTDLELDPSGNGGLRESAHCLVDMLEGRGVTSLLVSEMPEVFGQTQITREHISVIVDGIILLKYVEMESEIKRAVSVLKMRGSNHDKGIRQFTITDRGMTVQGRFEGTEGLMGGTPRATTIELAVRSFSEFDEKLNEELLERFAQLHHRVRPAPLNIPYNPDEAHDVVTRAMQTTQTSLSVVPLCMYWMPDVIDPARLSPLNDTLPEESWAEQLDGLVEPALIGEKLYAVPAIALCGVLLYRKDLLEEHGFAAPPRTWEDLVEQAGTICRADETGKLSGFEFPAYMYEGLSSSFLAHLWSNGGDVVDEGGRVALDSESALQALTYLHDVMHVHDLAPKNLTTPGHGVEPQTNFLEGRTVFLWMLPSVLQEARGADSPVNGKVGIAPPPIGPLGKVGHSFLGGWHYAVPQGAVAPSTARDFIRYMTGHDIQKERALRGGPLPTLKALYDDQEILAFNPHYRELKGIIAQAKSRAAIPCYPQVTKAIQQQLHPVLCGDAECEKALADLAVEVRGIVEAGQ